MSLSCRPKATPFSALEINIRGGGSWGNLHFLQSLTCCETGKNSSPHCWSNFTALIMLKRFLLQLSFLWRDSLHSPTSVPVGPSLGVAITNSRLPRPVLQTDGHWDCEQVADQNVSLFLSNPASLLQHSKYSGSSTGPSMGAQRLKSGSDSYRESQCAQRQFLAYSCIAEIKLIGPRWLRSLSPGEGCRHRNGWTAVCSIPCTLNRTSFSGNWGRWKLTEVVWTSTAHKRTVCLLSPIDPCFPFGKWGVGTDIGHLGYFSFLCIAPVHLGRGT